MKSENKAVVFGAGSIGRGFIGQVLHDSGYEIVFVDVNDALIAALNCHHAYPLTLTDGKTSTKMRIDRVSALHSSDTVGIVRELTDCTIAATAVGKNVLPYIAETIARGLQSRHKSRPDSPLNILLCENVNHAGEFLRDLISKHLPQDIPGPLMHAGLVQTTIGRMVPVPDPVTPDGEIPPMIAEPYCRLPIEQTAFRGNPPFLKYVETFDPFSFFEEKKLFVHNLGHASCAYFGALKGYRYIWQAIGDEEIQNRTRDIMRTLARAVASAYRTQEAELLTFADDLLERYSNRVLGDTVARVCKDPLRKLQPGDRFLGALKRCKAQALPCETVLQGIAAAMLYENTEDLMSMEMQKKIVADGVLGFLTGYCGLARGEGQMAEQYYLELKSAADDRRIKP